MIESDVEALSRAHRVVRRQHSAPDAGCGTAHYRATLNRAADAEWRCGTKRLPASGRPQPANALLSAAPHGCRGRAASSPVPTRIGPRPAELTRSVLDEARADAAVTPIDADGPARGDAPSGPRGCARNGHTCCRPGCARDGASTALRALRYRMLHHHAIRRTTAAVAERPRRNRGARGVVAAGPAVRVGRDRARPVRLFRAGPVVLRAGGYPLGPHHLSADQRRDPGAPFASPAGRSRLPARRDTCRWPSATIWSSKRPIRVPRCGSAHWAATSRFVGRYEMTR